MEREAKRNTGVDLLKIIAIFLIVIFHVVQTIIEEPEYLKVFSNLYIDISASTLNIKTIILQLAYHFGILGNNIFFMCSSWFLSDRKRTKHEKIIRMIIDTWIISVTYLLIYSISSENIDASLIKYSFLPNTYSIYWFITCYLLFYAISPYINVMLDNIKRETHFKLSISLFVIYYVIAFLVPNSFQFNNLINFICIYIIINYIKRYKINLCDDYRLNCKLLIVFSLFFVALILVSNITGVVIPSLSRKLPFRWGKNNNVFVIIMSFALFNIFRKIDFKSSICSKVSSLTMYIYLIHENIFFSYYSRVRIEFFLLEKFGNNHVLAIVFIFSVLLFLVSVIVSYVYQSIFSGFTNKLSQLLCKRIKHTYKFIKDKYM